LSTPDTPCALDLDLSMGALALPRQNIVFHPALRRKDVMDHAEVKSRISFQRQHESYFWVHLCNWPISEELALVSMFFEGIALREIGFGLSDLALQQKSGGWGNFNKDLERRKWGAMKKIIDEVTLKQADLLWPEQKVLYKFPWGELYAMIHPHDQIATMGLRYG
jgi:hypothetical protein